MCWNAPPRCIARSGGRRTMEKIAGGSKRRRRRCGRWERAWPNRCRMCIGPTGRSQPIRVDLVYYAGPFGSYTTLDPVHVMLSSADPSNQGPSGFELLFYEGSHAIGGSVEDGIVRECHVRGIPIPRDLWHALLFYTTAKMIGRVQAGAPPTNAPPKEVDSALSHNYAAGLTARGWQGYQRVLEVYWQEYLDGKVTFERALTAMVANL